MNRKVKSGVLAGMIAFGVLGGSPVASAAASTESKSSSDRSVVNSESATRGHIRLYDLKKVKVVGKQCSKKVVAEVRGPGPMRLTLTHEESVSNTYSTTYGISKWEVSIGVGYDVTKSKSRSMSGSYEVPRGKKGVLRAHPLYEVKSFNIHERLYGKYVGKGKAYRVLGYCYTHSAR